MISKSSLNLYLSNCLFDVISTQNNINNQPLSDFVVGTKAHPSQPGGLSPIGIKSQFEASQLAMSNIPHFGEYYLHQPDPDHGLVDSLMCLQNYHEQGLISTIGMSNYHASEMERAFEICAQYNIASPSVYQGLYNPLNRLTYAKLNA